MSKFLLVSFVSAQSLLANAQNAVQCDLLRLCIIIPAVPGVDHGSVLRLNGQGDTGSFGGKRGDIMLRFLVIAASECMFQFLCCTSLVSNKHCVSLQINPEDSFTRHGSDIHSTVPIAYTDAILGTQLEVQTLHGIRQVQIPAGTQHGSTLVLNGQGVKVWGAASPSFGAHHVKLHVVLPSSCNCQELQLLNQLKCIPPAPHPPQTKNQHGACAA